MWMKTSTGWSECRLTANVDFNLTEVEGFVGCFNLHYEVSARSHVSRAFQVDGSSFTHDTWIATTQVVVPQGRRCDSGWHVCESNYEVVRAKTWNIIELNMMINCKKRLKMRTFKLARCFAIVYYHIHIYALLRSGLRCREFSECHAIVRFNTAEIEMYILYLKWCGNETRYILYSGAVHSTDITGLDSSQIYVTVVVSSVGEENSKDIERCTKIDCPPRICFPMCINTAVVHFEGHCVIVAVVCPPRGEFTAVQQVRMHAAHECWSVQCHVHVQTTIYCISYKNLLTRAQLFLRWPRIVAQGKIKVTILVEIWGVWLVNVIPFIRL